MEPCFIRIQRREGVKGEIIEHSVNTEGGNPGVERLKQGWGQCSGENTRLEAVLSK